VSQIIVIKLTPISAFKFSGLETHKCTLNLDEVIELTLIHRCAMISTPEIIRVHLKHYFKWLSDCRSSSFKLINNIYTQSHNHKVSLWSYNEYSVFCLWNMLVLYRFGYL